MPEIQTSVQMLNYNFLNYFTLFPRSKNKCKKHLQMFNAYLHIQNKLSNEINELRQYVMTQVIAQTRIADTDSEIDSDSDSDFDSDSDSHAAKSGV